MTSRAHKPDFGHQEGALAVLLLVALVLLPAPASARQAGGDEAAAAVPLPPGLELFSASPFAVGTVLEAYTLRGLTGEVAGLILSADQGGDFAFESFATALWPIDGDKIYVPIFVEIDGAGFLENNQAETARVEVYVYALGADKAVAGYLAEVFAVDVKELGEAVWQRGLKYYGHLELAPGSYDLRVLVRNYQSKAAALRQIGLEVPAPRDFRESLVLTPIFPPPEDREAWLPVIERGEGILETDYPFVIENQPLSPAALPVLTARRSVRAHLLAYRMPAGTLDGRVELRGDDGTVESAPLQVLRRDPGAGDGPESLAIRFETPKVDPGSYTLRVELSGRKQKVLSPPLSVVVVASGTRERALLWTDLRGQIVTTAPEEAVARAGEPAASPRRLEARTQRREDRRRQLAERERLGALASRYREALALFGREDAAAARTALFELEAEVLTDGAGSSQSLRNAQLQVAEQLAAKDVEALIPILVLHQELYLTYRQRRLYSLTASSRTLIEMLAEIYAERGGTQGSGVVAARALASLGGYLQEANLPASSREMFQRALGLDPLSHTAMLGLATSFERYGEYSKAIGVLERLVALHPDLAECRLRLAVDLKRLGVRGRAVELLERALELEAPAWIHSLARQELARSLIETSSLEQAAAVLEGGLGADAEQSTVALLAHVYDRLRRPGKSLELLDGIAPRPAAGSSARKAYDSWPEGPMAEVRQQLAEAAAMRRGLIEELLNGAPEADP
ncbi:MAG: hypothetical protein V3T72_05940 [Thermoanaerobaculia bacterium]